jgi:hypothetical protein
VPILFSNRPAERSKGLFALYCDSGHVISITDWGLGRFQGSEIGVDTLGFFSIDRYSEVGCLSWEMRCKSSEKCGAQS